MPLTALIDPVGAAFAGSRLAEVLPSPRDLSLAAYDYPVQEPPSLLEQLHAAFPSSSIVLGVILALILVTIALRNAKVIQQYEKGIVLRLGRYARTVGPGLALKWPLLETITVVDQRTSAISISGQEALSRDNVPVKMTVVAWLRIIDALKSVVEIEDAPSAVQRVAVTSLVTEIGKNNLDTLLKDRDAISETLKARIDKVTETWGYEVTRLEIQNVEIPSTMQRALAAVAEAGREREAVVIRAQGEVEASAKLAEAGRMLASSPGSLDLRRLQTMAQVGAEQNSTIILAMPMEFIQAAAAVANMAGSRPAPDGGAARAHDATYERDGTGERTPNGSAPRA